MEVMNREKPPSHVMKRETAVAAVACLLLLSAAGGGLIVWWALSFHRDNDRLWMVPIALVLIGTPIVAWVSVFASDACRQSELLLTTTVAGDENSNPVRDIERGDRS